MTETLLLTVGAFVAGAVSGATGFGFALVATALWSHVLEPRVVTVLALVYMLLLNVGYLPVFWRRIPWRRLAPFAVGGVLGVPLGAWALDVLPARVLRPAVGAVLLVYGVAMLRRATPRPLALAPATGRWLDAGVGLAGGVLGGLAGLSGFLPTVWCALRGDDKSANRALVQAYILLTGVLSVAWVGALVGIDGQVRGQLLLGLPFVVAGGVIGLRVFARLDTARFHRLVLWVLAVCGAALLLRA